MLYVFILFMFFISAVLPWHQFAARLQETKDPLKVRLLVIVIDDDVVQFLSVLFLYYFRIIAIISCVFM